MTTNPGHPDPNHRHRPLDHPRTWPARSAAATNADPVALQLFDDQDEGDPWAFQDPRRNRTAIAYTDHDTNTLIREAVVTLTIFRAPMGLGDHGATVSVLVSLAAEAEGQLWDAVANARDQGYTWADIADRLATSITTARRRYAAYNNWRRTQPPKYD